MKSRNSSIQKCWMTATKGNLFSTKTDFQNQWVDLQNMKINHSSLESNRHTKTQQLRRNWLTKARSRALSKIIEPCLQVVEPCLEIQSSQILPKLQFLPIRKIWWAAFYPNITDSKICLIYRNMPWKKPDLQTLTPSCCLTFNNSPQIKPLKSYQTTRKGK